MSGHIHCGRGKVYLILILMLMAVQAFPQGRIPTLSEIDQSYKTFRTGADARILDYLKKNPTAKAAFTRNHAVYLIVDINENGIPEYFRTDNATEAATLNVPALRIGGSLGVNITGTGIKLATWDGGKVRSDHVELVGRVTFGDGTATLDDHATHTSGTMIASGVNASAKGMAPSATLIAFDFNNDVSEMTGQAKPDQTSIILSNHSYGTLTGWEFDGSGWVWHGDPAVSTTVDYKFGFYDTQTQSWDNIAFNAPYYLIVKAAGNDRSDTGDGSKPADGSNGGYDCIPTFGVAKNILTVGAVQNLGSYTQPSDVVMTSFSSWGPTDDGRIKPDLVAPGLNVFSSFSSSTTAYSTISGTSMSTPTVTGTLGLLQQLYKSLNQGNYMRSATLKALAIHTCREAGPNSNPGPDYSFGWGLLDAEAAGKIIINKDNQNVFMTEGTLTSGQTFSMSLGIPKLGTKIKATLVWTDPAGTPSTPSVNNPVAKLVNDLDLRIVDDANVTTFPWILNPASPSAAATTGDNTRDNVEKIELASTLTRNYTLKITNKGALSGGSQAFSLILEYSSQIDPLTSYYWIGDTGSWEDGSHWSLTSGGAPAAAVPAAANRVVFDEKSFSGPGATVSMTADESVTSLRWLGNQFPVNFSMNGHALNISENTTLLTTQLATPTPGTINFTSASTALNSVDLNSNILDKITLNFNGASSWAMTGTPSLDKINIVQGLLKLNGCSLKLNQLNSTGNGSLTFITSSVQALTGLSVDFTGVTLVSDNTSSIIISPVVVNSINVSNKNFQGLINMQSGDVSITGTGTLRSISGNGIVRLNGQMLTSNLTLSGGSQLVLQSGATQTFTDKFTLSTSSTLRVAIKASSTAAATLAFSNYYKLCVDNVDITNVNVDVTNNSVVNAGLGSTIIGSSNWLKVDCSTIVFPDFTFNYTCAKASVYFTDASSGTITSRAWNFGDPSSTQNTTTLTSPLHYYAAAGTYSATLTVTGASGSRSISKSIVLAANDLVDNTVQISNGSLISTQLSQTYQWLKDGQIISGATSRSYTYTGVAGEYAVLTFSTACNKKSAPFVITEIEKDTNTQVPATKVYPNPTSDYLQIETSSKILATAIMDATGRQLMLEPELISENRYRLNVSAIPSGLYILKVNTQEKVELVKIIIRK